MLNERFSLHGRRALITGGSRGLGLAMAAGFLEAGAQVAICGRSAEALQWALEILSRHGSDRIATYAADLTVRDQTERLARQVRDDWGGVDILVHNAGTNRPQPVEGITDEAWDSTLELNLTSGMVLTRALVPEMMRKQWGRILHISSIMGLASKAGRHSYSASKAGLLGLMRAAALDLGPHNITVNCIAPGPFLTDLTAGLLSDEEQRVAAERTAVGRWGKADELVGPALLLASDAGSYITGSVLVVDGGLLCKTF